MSMSAVEWKKLGDVCEVGTGSNNREDACYNGLYPFYVRSKDVLRINKYLFDEEAIIIPGEGGIGDIFHYANGKYGLHQRAYRVHPIDDEVVCKYLYYYLSDKFKQYIISKSVGATATSIRKPMLEGFMLPIPSLAKQQEIVSHLDTFTTLISNLESELDMRRKQYEHYRNQLLDISDKDSSYIVPFGDICKIIRGNGVQKSDFVDVGVGCIHYGQIYTYYGSYSYTTNRFVSQDVFNKAVKASKGDIIMTDTSENVEDICKSVAYLGDEDIAVSNHSFIIKHNQNPKYLSFCTLTYSFGLQKKKVVFGAKVSSIKQDNLAKINIYLPPIEEQNQIVSKLDTFKNLIQSLEQEIKLRKQQYEYYREKLLTFE